MIAIARAKPENAETLTRIAHDAKRQWGYPENWIAAWRDVLTIRPQFITRNVSYCAVDEGRIFGFYILTNENHELRLDHLWVEPEAMRRGIGRALFEHAVMQARSLGFNSIRIEADPNAEGFYQRMGAVRVGTSTGKIEGQRRDLPLLEFSLGDSS